MVTGVDIRRYRKVLGLSQVEVARRIGISQSAQSSLESGRIAVSDDLLVSFKERFSAPSFNPSFSEFLRGVKDDGKAPDSLAVTIASRYLTLTVWRWYEGIDLSRVPPADQAVGLVTIPATDRATIAFEMIGPTAEWKKSDVLVFSECKLYELRVGEPCVIQFRRGKRSLAILGVATGIGAAFKVQSARGGPHIIPKDSILATFREELRVTRAARP